MESDRELHRELRLAHLVQRGVLPRAAELPGLRVFARMRTAREIGGDFYDFHMPHGDGPVGVLIGDVSGRGIPAALMMMVSVTVLRDAARRGSSPRDILETANRELREHFPEDVREHFVTVCYVSFDPARRIALFANAGHERPLVWRARYGSVEEVPVRGLFLITFEDVQIEEVELELEAGDRILLYTDGVIESRNPQGEYFGVDRLSELLRRSGSLTCDALGEAVLGEVASFRGNPHPHDDEAAVVLEVRGED